MKNRSIQIHLRITESIPHKYSVSILFTGIVESKGNSQNAIQSSIQNTDEVAVKFLVDQLYVQYCYTFHFPLLADF